MDILAILLITVVVAGGGLWIVSRESPPADKHSDNGKHHLA
jgi:hypothetical protein